MKALSITSCSRCALIIGSLLWARASAHAQKPFEFDRTIEFASAFDHAQEKFIHEGIRDQDPAALVWIDVTGQQVLVRVHVELDRAQLQAAVAASGLHITYLGPPRIEAEGLKSLNSTSMAPVYRDSGDPASDNARYEIEKRTWIETRPDLYQQQLQAPPKEQ